MAPYEISKEILRSLLPILFPVNVVMRRMMGMMYQNSNTTNIIKDISLGMEERGLRV